MTIRVQRETFLNVLESCQAGLAQREIVEQSTCFVFKTGKVCSFNDDVCCRAPSGLPDDFTGAVRADRLLDTLRKWTEDEIEIEPAEGELVLVGKRRKAGVRMEAEVTLPVDTVEKPDKWAKLPDDFLDAVNLVGQCASRDESKFRLTCLNITPEWVEATDDFQVARFVTATGFPASVLVKNNSIKNIVGLGVTKFCVTDSWLHFKNAAGVMFSCRKFAEEYPDLSPYLSEKGGTPTALPKGLVEAADKAMVFSQDNEDNVVQVEIKPGRLRLRGEGAAGWYTESKKLESYKGPPVTFLITPELLSALVTKHPEVIISAERLRVDSGKFQYFTVLHAPSNEPAPTNGEAEEQTPTPTKKNKRREPAETE